MSTEVLHPKGHTRQRRSQRVLLAVRVVLQGRRSDDQSFKEETRTVVVNAHGALILLAEKVNVAQPLTILNLRSGEQVHCRVTDVGDIHNGKHEVGIESWSLPRAFGALLFRRKIGPRTHQRPNAAQTSRLPIPR